MFFPLFISTYLWAFQIGHYSFLKYTFLSQLYFSLKFYLVNLNLLPNVFFVHAQLHILSHAFIFSIPLILFKINTLIENMLNILNQILEHPSLVDQVNPFVVIVIFILEYNTAIT